SPWSSRCVLQQDQRVVLPGDNAESINPDNQRLLVLQIGSAVDNHGELVLIGRNAFRRVHRVWICENMCFQLSIDVDLESFTVSCTNRDGGCIGSSITRHQMDGSRTHITHPRPLCAETIVFG
ncbi:hypothetical protein HispidOSU_011908, partial [Sigmodon hispidus]